MRWLLRLVNWLGRIKDIIVRMVVKVTLFLVYILGVAAMAAGLRLRALVGSRPADKGFMPRKQSDCAPHIVE